MRRGIKRSFWVFVIGLLVIGGSLMFLDQTLGSGMCETTVYARATAQNGTTVAKVQMTDCGATTGYSPVVMVEEPGLWKRQCRALALKYEPKVNLTWSDQSLVIVHNARNDDLIAKNAKCLGHPIKIVQEA